MSELMYNEEDDAYCFECPHCSLMCQVTSNEVNCKIFRHAVFKINMTFVEPHATKEECDKWVMDGLVWGCGKPCKFEGDKVVKCGYI
jgi:hypothetical protein